MVEAADLTINVEADGVPRTVAELKLLDAAIDNNDDSIQRVAESGQGLSSIMSGLALNATRGNASIVGLSGSMTALVVAVAPAVAQLASAALGLVGIAGGAVGAAPGVLALGGAFAYVGSKALEAKTGTDNFADAMDKFLKTGAMGKAMQDLQKAARPMFDEFWRFAQTIGPAVVGTFTSIVKVLQDILGPVLRVLTDQALKWLGVLRDSVAEVAPLIAPALKRISEAFLSVFKSLIPLIEPGVKALVSIIQGLAQGLVGLFKPMAPFLETIGKQFGNLLAIIGVQLGRFFKAAAPFTEQFMRVFGRGLEVIGEVLRHLGQAGPAATGFMKGLVGILQGLVPVSKEIAKQAPAIGKFFATLGKAIGASNLLQILVRVFGMLAEILTPVIKLFGQMLAEIGPPLMKFVEALLQAIRPMLDEWVKLAQEALPPVIELLIELMRVFTPLIKVITPLIRVLAPIAAVLMTLGTRILLLVIRGLTWLLKKAREVVEFLGPILLPVVKAVGRVFLAVIGPIVRFAQRAWEVIKGWWENLKGLPAKVGEIIGNVIDWFAKLPGRIANILTGLVGKAFDWARDIGHAIVQGLASGIHDLAQQAAQAAADMVHKAIDAAKDIAGAHSPSTVMRELGRNIADGLAMGVREGTPGVRLAVAGLSTEATGELGVTMGAAARAAAVERGGRLTGTLRIINWDDGRAYIDARVERGVERRAAFEQRMARMRR